MFRLWGKIVTNDSIIANYVFKLSTLNMSIEEKLDKGLEEICYNFDIQRPMWFSDNNRDITMIAKTKFKGQNFIENIDFDYFEIEIIENKE